MTRKSIKLLDWKPDQYGQLELVPRNWSGTSDLICRQSFSYLLNLLDKYYPHSLPPSSTTILEKYCTNFSGSSKEYCTALLEIASTMDDAHAFVSPKPIASFCCGFVVDPECKVSRSINPEIPVGSIILAKNGVSIEKLKKDYRHLCRGPDDMVKGWYYLQDFLSFTETPNGATFEIQLSNKQRKSIHSWASYNTFATWNSKVLTSYEIKNQTLLLQPEAQLTTENVLEDIPKLLKENQEVDTIHIDLRQYPSDPMSWYQLFSELNNTGHDIPTIYYYSLSRPTAPEKKNRWRRFKQKVEPATQNNLYEQIKTVKVRYGLESLSQSEQYIMILQELIPKTGRKLILDGGKTSGANGNVSEVFLPGGYKININFDYVTYLDGRHMQRVGIQRSPSLNS
jgi:hypothetical protein